MSRKNLKDLTAVGERLRRCGVVGIAASNPAGWGILISTLWLGVCPLCSVLCCLWQWPCHSAFYRFQRGPPLCICLVFWSKVCAHPIVIWFTDIWVVSLGVYVLHWRRINNKWVKKYKKGVFARFSGSLDHCAWVSRSSMWSSPVIFTVLHPDSYYRYRIIDIIVHRCGASGSMRACHAAGPGSIPGRDKFPGWGFFRGFPSPIRQMSGNFRPPPSSPNIIWPSSSFHLRLIGMTECVIGVYCLSCLCCLGGGPGIGLITHPGRTSMSLCGQKACMWSIV